MAVTFHIERPNPAIRPALQDKIDNLTKPKGSLGLRPLDVQGPLTDTLFKVSSNNELIFLE